MELLEQARKVNAYTLETIEEAKEFERVMTEYYGQRTLRLILINNMDTRECLLDMDTGENDITGAINTTIEAIDRENKRIRKALEILGS